MTGAALTTCATCTASTFGWCATKGFFNALYNPQMCIGEYTSVNPWVAGMPCVYSGVCEPGGPNGPLSATSRCHTLFSTLSLFRIRISRDAPVRFQLQKENNGSADCSRREHLLIARATHSVADICMPRMSTNKPQVQRWHRGQSRSTENVGVVSGTVHCRWLNHHHWHVPVRLSLSTRCWKPIGTCQHMYARLLHRRVVGVLFVQKPMQLLHGMDAHRMFSG